MDIKTCSSRRKLSQTSGKRAVCGAAIGIAPRYSGPAWFRHLLDQIEPAGGTSRNPAALRNWTRLSITTNRNGTIPRTARSAANRASRS